MNIWPTVGALVAVVLSCASVNAQTFYEVSDFGPTNHFGLSGSRAIVEDEIVERQPGGGWAVVANLSNGLDVTDCDVFGDTAAIARGGAIDIYDRQPDGTWLLSTTLISPTLEPLTNPVQLLNEDEFVVGHTFGGGTNPAIPRGYLIQFRRSALTGIWLNDVFTPGSEPANDFGRHVSSDGQVVIVAAYWWFYATAGAYIIGERDSMGLFSDWTQLTFLFNIFGDVNVISQSIGFGPAAVLGDWFIAYSPGVHSSGPLLFLEKSDVAWRPPIYLAGTYSGTGFGASFNAEYEFAVGGASIFQHDEVLDRWVETATLPTTLSSDGLVATEGKTVIAEGKILEAEYFVRGDVTTDGTFGLTDVLAQLGGLFGGSTLLCPDAADFDDDGLLALNDVVLLLGALFQGETLPAPTQCGEDLTPDALRCPFYSGCP